MIEAGRMGYVNGANILNNNVATQAFQESLTNLTTAFGANEVACGASQQQYAAQNPKAANMQITQQQI